MPAANGSAPAAGEGAIITEVVVQGVRRFGDVRRFALGPGYNVMHGLVSSGKSTMHDVMLSLLFARPAAAEAESFASLLPQGKVACRAGMTLSLGGELWRVLKDYQQGVTTLSRFNAAEKRFDLVLSDAEAVRRWLIDTARLPAGPEAATLCAFSRAELPSNADGDPGRLVKPESDDAGFEDRIRGLSLPDKKALLVQLLDEYRRHAEVRTTEYLQDGLRSKLFELDAVRLKRAEVRKKMDEVELEFRDYANVPALPDGIEERIEAYKRQEKQREADLANLVPARDAARTQLELLVPRPYDETAFRAIRTPADLVLTPLKRDWMVGAGLAAFAAGVVTSFFGSTAMKVGALLVFGGIGVVAWRGIFVFYRALESFSGLRKDVDRIDEQLRVMERKWDIETSVVRNLMKAYDVDDPREMREIEKKRDEGRARLAELQKQMDAIQVPGGKDPDKEHARITGQIADLDLRLQELSKDMTSDPRELEPQIERLDREVARAEGRRPTSRKRLFQNADDGAPEEAEGDPGNAFTRLLARWTEARRAEPGRVLRAIQEPFARNLRGLSAGRFTAATFDAEGNVSVREEPRGTVTWETIDGPGRDLCYLALRITLFQLDAKGEGRSLVVLDDPFDYEEGRLQAISRALRSLTPRAQVVHITSRSAHGKLADRTLEI